jgi:hypothetical protein
MELENRTRPKDDVIHDKKNSKAKSTASVNGFLLGLLLQLPAEIKKNRGNIVPGSTPPRTL